MARYVFLFNSSDRHETYLNVENPPLILTIAAGADVHLTARLYLFGGNAFNVEVSSSNRTENPGQLADILMHMLSGLYDSLGLSTGKANHLDLVGFIDLDTGAFARLSMTLPDFANEIREAQLSTHDWIGLSVGSPQLRAALRDVRLAMDTPGDVAVHCYRAIERIRQAFSHGNDRRQSWERLAAALNVKRSWLDSYTAHATAVRHGELVELPLRERDACLRQAAIVTIRFAAFLKENKTNLSAPVFPLLS